MRILVIGGNGFLGSALEPRLRDSGHEAAVFHRGADAARSGTTAIRGDRNRLADSWTDLRAFSPDVIVDLILSSADQAIQLMEVAQQLGARVVAISSMDVYRAWGVLQGVEAGPLEKLPVTEDAALRTNRRLYSPETIQGLRSVFSWLNEQYDKIGVEEAVMKHNAQATIVRLPMVYGPGDPLHRWFLLLKRVRDGRPAILLAEDIAAWRGPRGYVENVAHAIAAAAVHPRAAGRVYNVCDEPALTELDWQTEVARLAGWQGRFVILPRQKMPQHLLVPGNTAQEAVVSSARIREELGYQEPVQQEEAIRRTLAWEEKHPPQIIPEQFDYGAEDAALRAAGKD